MSTLSFQNGALHAGINNHLHYQQDPNVSASTGIVQLQDLLFNVNTIKIASMAGKWLHSLRKSQPNNLAIYVTGLPGKTITLDLNQSDTVKDLKALIQEKEGVSSMQQRLFLNGRELDDGKTLREYNLGGDSTLYLVLQLREQGCSAQRIHKDCFDDQFHMDFTKTNNQQLCSRGGAAYTLPLGSMRYALKVLNKYRDNAWLGIFDRRNELSCAGEWPVAYHGTTDPRAAQIVGSGGFDLNKGTRFAYGYGIYCTPDPNIALSYASPYVHNGKYYKLIFQVRVDPSRRDVVPHMNYWIAKENDAIRPYGICVYPC